jgi:aminoglycoside phosphotransferase (APT) family kinase protein
VTVTASDTLDRFALSEWLRLHIEGFVGPITIEKFAEGQSNPTYRIEAASGVYVLRRQPFGDLLPSAHAIDREFRLISALYPFGFPVPKPLYLCESRVPLGAMFYVMEMVSGRTECDGSLPTFSRSERRAAYDEMTNVLAVLHTIDPTLAGLADYGRPGKYFERQTSRWIRQYRATESEHIGAMERLIE